MLLELLVVKPRKEDEDVKLHAAAARFLYRSGCEIATTLVVLLLYFLYLSCCCQCLEVSAGLSFGSRVGGKTAERPSFSTARFFGIFL